MDELYKELFQDQFPIGFTYGEKDAELHGLPWTVLKETLQEYELERYRAVLEDSLHIEMTVRRFRDSETLEWYVTLQNASSYDTKTLSNIDLAHFDICFDPSTTPFFLDYNGSNEQMCDFMENRTQMFHNARRTLRCTGGRSSSVVMPYFQMLMNGYGYTLAIGWSGQWRADFLRPGDDGVIRVRAGMEDASFRLHPGETVTLPHMLVQRCEGDEYTVFNGYRRFAQRYVVPRIDGKPVQAPITIGAWGGSTAAQHLRNIEALKQHDAGLETYWIDAGWYGDVASGNVESDGSWYRNAGIGDWQPSRALYPNGMEEIADAAHDIGMGFLLWYEPERCRTCAERVSEHPDWYIGLRRENGDMMLNLGNPEALAWITGVIGDSIEKYRMDVLRIDFNFGPLSFWQYADTPDRRGISELRFVAGFYKMWDDLLKRFPHLIIDNCASGGRRLDFEALRRSIPLFRTDYACFGLLDKPTATQLHTYYLSRFVPVNSTSVNFAEKDTYRVRSCLAGGISAGGLTADASKDIWLWSKQTLAVFKRLREYTMADLWPLTGCSFSDQDWMAYQLSKPEEGRGVIVAYRRENSQIRLMDLQLRDIAPDATYELTDEDLGTLGHVSGRLLLESWPFEIKDKRTCRIVYYQRIAN